jgi:ADP-L-glycero-D-manno-heptose 6-epimerase
LIYASSAATYGDGKMGYNDEFKIEDLKPLNPYAHSKHNFDLWVESQKIKPDFWVGLKFFNVYGPNEYHKNRMASVVYHAFNQIKQTGAVSLFKSHNDNFNDGEQLRDFVYVKDLLSVIVWMLKNKPKSGIYNLGSGEARSFNSLVNSIFNTLDLTPQITYIDTPIDIRNAYQYYTQATMNKLKSAGYNQEFYSLEAGVSDYVRNYLSQAIYY